MGGATVIATFKDLCSDAADAPLVAQFWGDLLGLEVDLLRDSGAAVRRDGEAFLWVDPVPEPKVVKNRVHLDLWVRPGTDLTALGATLLADQGEFLVYADPEGNELCAFPAPPDSEPGPPARWLALCTDSAHPADDAAWWSDVVGGELGPGPDGALRYLHGAAGLGDVVWKFVPVPDRRVAKNRWHWDVIGRVDDLVAAGAQVLRARDDEIGWTVMADPSGNEFCAFDPPS